MRVLGAWLGLSYVCATALGAAGVSGCIHATMGGGTHGHGVHESTLEHHTPLLLPCAAGEDEAPAEPAPHHGPTDPCDCLGDCSVGTGLADLSSRCSFEMAAPAGVETSLPAPACVAAFPDQHRLPYPNAPPLP